MQSRIEGNSPDSIQIRSTRYVFDRFFANNQTIIKSCYEQQLRPLSNFPGKPRFRKTAGLWAGNQEFKRFAKEQTTPFLYVPQLATYQGLILVYPADLGGTSL